MRIGLKIGINERPIYEMRDFKKKKNGNFEGVK